MTNKPIIVIGGGPAGLIAARAVAEKGQKAIIIDREEHAGGILNQCIHAGFGLEIFKEELTGPEFADRVHKMAVEAGVEIRLKTTVLHIDNNKKVTMVSPEKGVESIDAAAVILCTGCRERARGVIHIPGERPAGIFCAGLAQKFVNIDGYLPGRKIVILGSGDIGLIMARRLTLQGAKVQAVLEAASAVGGLSRNVVQCLHDFDIPLYISHTITDIVGRNRVEKVVVSKVNENFRPIAGTEFEIECDTVLLSVGLIPENEVAETAGVELHPVTNGAIVDENYMTNIEGVFACGNALHVHDLVDKLALESEKVGYNAAEYAAGKDFKKSELTVKHDSSLGYVLPHKASGDNDVTFHFRVKKSMEGATLRAGEFRKKFRFLMPNEMSSVTIPKDQLNTDNDKEIEIWIEKS